MRVLKAICLSSLVLAAVPAAAADKQPTSAAVRSEADEKRAKARAEAEEALGKIVAAYMEGRWDDLKQQLRDAARHVYSFTPQERIDLAHIRRTAAEFQPTWWKSVKSLKNVSFTARIWNRPFTANYVPSDALGVQQAVAIVKGKLVVIVSWRPNVVDSARPALGELAKRHGITEGDIAQVIIWHELGHNYISNFLKLKHVIELYTEHFPLYMKLQEFYADLTAVYHASPRARKAILMVRLDALAANRFDEPHTRAAYAIGSLILANVLAKPEDWPSVHLPPAVPKADAERSTLIYLYEHLDPKWTVAEDRELREIIRRFITSQGEGVLRNKGKVPLPNRLSFCLQSADDQEHQPKRDAWVAEMLQKAIQAGRADKPDMAPAPPLRLYMPE